jgi:hypothetical protein
MNQKIVLVLLLLFGSATAQAAYDEKNRSIGYTAETLEDGNSEIGLATFSYGVTDDLMLSLPTTGYLFGLSSADLKYRIEVSPSFAIAPSVGAGIYWGDEAEFSGNARLNATYRFGNGRHALSVGAGVAQENVISFEDTAKDKAEFGFGWYLNYDWYLSNGNLLYAGLLGTIPYLGHTWAWEHFHFGLGLADVGLGDDDKDTGAEFVLPYLYFYWRF